jgi:hypothetical protein
MDFPIFAYRCPGAYVGPHGLTYDVRDVLSAADVETVLADGWSISLENAFEQYLAARSAPAAQIAVAPNEVPDNAPPTRSEMLQQAERIGLKVDKRWGDDRLRDAIAAKTQE